MPWYTCIRIWVGAVLFCDRLSFLGVVHVILRHHYLFCFAAPPDAPVMLYNAFRDTWHGSGPVSNTEELVYFYAIQALCTS